MANKTEREQQSKGIDSISRRSVLKATGVGAVGVAAFSGTASAHCPCVGKCKRLGKVDRAPSAGDSYTFEYQGQSIEIVVTNVRKEDGEVVCADVETGPNTTNVVLCRVDVKGGPDSQKYDCQNGAQNQFNWNSSQCKSTAVNLCAPYHHNRNRSHYEISNMTFYICDQNGDNPGVGGSCKSP